MRRFDLSKPPHYRRSETAMGIGPRNQKAVDRTGGDYGAGIIRGFAVVSRGEALGHDVWLDDVFLSQVANAINSSRSGRKSRFTHPSLSSDGLGKFLGRT